MKKYVITISYGDYTSGVGGTDKVILSQQNILLKNRYGHVHLFPYRFKSVFLWGMLIDGIFKGYFSKKSL